MFAVLGALQASTQRLLAVAPSASMVMVTTHQHTHTHIFACVLMLSACSRQTDRTRSVSAARLVLLLLASFMNTGCLCSNVPFREEIYNIKKTYHNRPLSSICGKFKLGHADFRMFKWKQVPEPPSWISTILFSDFRKH